MADRIEEFQCDECGRMIMSDPCPNCSRAPAPWELAIMLRHLAGNNVPRGGRFKGAGGKFRSFRVHQPTEIYS
jgi:hypothetical protein